MMHTGLSFLALFMMALVGLAAVVGPCVLVFLILRALLSRRDSQQLTRDERMQLVKLGDILARMEDRVGNLETILMRADRSAAGAESMAGKETNR